jgi:hypothetical protein
MDSKVIQLFKTNDSLWSDGEKKCSIMDFAVTRKEIIYGTKSGKLISLSF